MLGCLLENATKFTEKGRIALTVEQKPTDGGDVRFIVEDTGCGISREAQPFIFDRFTKGDEFSKGLGLGLAYCYETAQKLGGGLKHDTGYTHGARFIITLPLSCS
jgi:signal transduction histidine kinase